MADWGAPAGEMDTNIVDVQGGKIQVYGFRKIKYYVQLAAGATRLVQSTFMVSDVQKMILSAGQLLEAGIDVYAGKDKDKRYLEFPDKARAAMEVRGKSFYIRGRVMASSAVHQAHVAPVDDDMGDKKAAALSRIYISELTRQY